MSLLKRLEQGQEGDSQGSTPPEANSDAPSGGGSRLSSLQARRTGPADAKRDTYLDLKTRVQNRRTSLLEQRRSWKPGRRTATLHARSDDEVRRGMGLR